ncbi:MAG TPA: hypothetical protein VMG10_03405 [Gemmataceae bacterium]|nr:hypothetical protein [Gemmataceae bacterium]
MRMVEIERPDATAGYEQQAAGDGQAPDNDFNLGVNDSGSSNNDGGTDTSGRAAIIPQEEEESSPPSR